MKTVGDVLALARKAKKISLEKAARDLLIKKEILEGIEKGQWHNLPEPAFVRGFIKNYADYLDLDSSRLLAIYRREYDEKIYPKRTSVFEKKNNLTFTPPKIVNIISVFAVIIFIAYILIQYFSFLSVPKLSIKSPQNDYVTSIPVVEITGQTEKGATVSVNGEFAAVNSEGDFSYQLKLKEGKNILEVIASRRLSPKSKITRTIRLIR